MLLCLVLTIPYPWWGRTVVFSLVKFWDLRKASCSSVVSPPPVAVISRRGEAGCGSIRQPGVYGVAVSSDGAHVAIGYTSNWYDGCCPVNGEHRGPLPVVVTIAILRPVALFARCVNTTDCCSTSCVSIDVYNSFKPERALKVLGGFTSGNFYGARQLVYARGKCSCLWLLIVSCPCHGCRPHSSVMFQPGR